ncbi:Tn3 transposase DDE domain-containing protein [Nocardia mexicana]|uniref:Tn3 transposase DDE domain-containing protein n=1 Tax=Nocardia mexicana TaxID=279262 RepID=A0A370HDZ7_9NOCA|nr:Tn3 family transposase [Nocardia mexicana]RDI55464.1 Tn3 transposase DDE domain-containing protein [Nocardia mexicana]
MIRARHLEAQTEQAWCLTLAANAVIAWTSEYYRLAVDLLRRGGRRIDDEVLAHISPAHSENIRVTAARDLEGVLACGATSKNLAAYCQMLVY